jgi:hypothetical protein
MLLIGYLRLCWLIALSTLLLLSATIAPPPTELQGKLARLEDGTRIRCEDAEAGAEAFETEWGRFLCPGNPVIDVIEADADVKALEALREYDYNAYLQQCSKRGFLQPLLDAADLRGKKAEAVDQPTVLAVLEAWGPYFDPVPSRTEASERVSYLWDQLEKSKPGEAALLTGRMLAEMDRKLGTSHYKKVTLADLRRALRSKHVGLRRAAALVGQKQDELQFWQPMLAAATEDDHAGVRAACAKSVMAMNSEKALSGFSSALWRGKTDRERMAAAEHLGDHGDALSIDVLMVPLQASTVTGGPASAFAHFGRHVSVVADFDVEIAASASIADPRVVVLQEGTALQVRVVSTRVVRTVMASLKKLTRSNPGPRPEDWLRWYEER